MPAYLVRKVACLLAAVLFAFVVGIVHAQGTTCYQWSYTDAKGNTYTGTASEIGFQVTVAVWNNNCPYGDIPINGTPELPTTAGQQGLVGCFYATPPPNGAYEYVVVTGECLIFCV